MMGEEINIFYIDDDKDDREIFKDAAEDLSRSLQVITQSDGRSLIEMLYNPPPTPSMLFLDLNMPVMNGYEVLEKIRSSEATRNLPVIIFSTSDDPSAISRTRELGANLYIPKPSSYARLKEAIAYTMTIDWSTFLSSDASFVYRFN